MATGEDQPHHVVVECRRLIRLVRARRVEFDLVRQLVVLAAKRDGATNAVDRLVAPDIDQPGARIRRRIFLGPSLQCHGERILQRVLCEIEIADEADQRGQRPARLVAEQFFDFGRGHWDFALCTPSFRGVRSTNPEPRDSQMCNCTSQFDGFASPRNVGCAVNYKPRSAAPR